MVNSNDLDSLISNMYEVKGITLKYNIKKSDVKEYFLNKNNYFRVASYRKNFQKYQRGVNKDKYINLDFKCLIELSKIDKSLRSIFINICIDIEHKLKVVMLADIESRNIDSSGIVKRFLDKYKYILSNIERSSSSPYTKNLIRKYFEIEQKEDEVNHRISNKILKYDKCPMWVLVEILGFGDFLNCYEFYCNETNQEMIVSKNILHSVRSIRNCCAHNNCLINNLYTKDAYPSAIITKFISSIGNIKDKQRKNKLSCRPILEMVSVLYVCDKLNINSKELNHLEELFENDLIEVKDCFIKNELLVTQYKFMLEVIRHIKKLT